MDRSENQSLPTYGEIRKDYVRSRVESLLSTMRFGALGNWRQAAKNEAHREFNTFIQAERDKAAQEARLAGLAEGWDQACLHREAHPDKDSAEYWHNPYRKLLRQRERES